MRKGFVNIEKAAFGGEKLKIPMLLFVEKIRTQSRFNVCGSFFVLYTASTAPRIKTRAPGVQLMRTMGTSPADTAMDKGVGERKPAHNASAKVSLVVQRMLFPMLDGPMRTHVLLDAEADQVELDLLDQVGRQKPALIEDQQCLFQHLQSLLERYKHRRGGPAYARVSPQ